MVSNFLSKEVLKGFDKYKYNAMDTSPISNYISHPFWNWIVQYYPLWLAPNIITLVGFLYLVAAVGLLAVYDYDMHASDFNAPTAPVPGVVFALVGIFIFMAHTLDGTDGKQARRTNSCGPLGELFDHGIDSWSVSLCAICVFSIFGCGGAKDFSVDAIDFLYIQLAIMCIFFITHWEKYNSGLLYLPWSYDMAQYSMSAIFLITGYYGAGMWKFYIPYFDGKISTGNLIISGIYVCVLGISLPMSIYNIYYAYSMGTARVRSYTRMVRPFLTFTQLFISSLLWAHLSSNHIVDLQPRMYYILIGIIFSHVATKLIVVCMSDTDCELYNYLSMPLLVILAFSSRMSASMEILALYVYTTVALVIHLHYCSSVVIQLAQHMNIKVFKIKPLTEKS